MGFPRQECWSGCCFLLQGIFLTQRSTHIPCIGRQILYQLGRPSLEHYRPPKASPSLQTGQGPLCVCLQSPHPSLLTRFSYLIVFLARVSVCMPFQAVSSKRAELSALSRCGPYSSTCWTDRQASSGHEQMNASYLLCVLQVTSSLTLHTLFYSLRDFLPSSHPFSSEGRGFRFRRGHGV